MQAFLSTAYIADLSSIALVGIASGFLLAVFLWLISQALRFVVRSFSISSNL